jgi:hypothetical protein
MYTLIEIRSVRREAHSRRFNGWLDKVRAWEATPENERSRRRPSRPPFLHFQDNELNPHRYMCLLAFPWLNHDSGSVEWGVGCNGCRDDHFDRQQNEGSFEKQQIMYSTWGFLRHYVCCPKAQDLYEKRYEDQIAGAPKLRPCWEPICDLAGDLSSREPGPGGERVAITKGLRLQNLREGLTRRQRRAGRRSEADNVSGNENNG